MTRPGTTRPQRPSATDELAFQIKTVLKLHTLQECGFHPSRKWRFDLVIVTREGINLHTAIEIDGAVWAAGRHTRGAGFISDCEKLNEAQLLGWKVYRFTPQQVRNGTAMAFLERVFPEAK